MVKNIKKVANIVCTYPPYRGGIGTSAYVLRKLLVARGYDVTTFVPDYGYHVSAEEDQRDSVKRLKPFLKLGNGAFLPQLFFVLKDFDVLFLHYPFFGGAEIVLLLKLIYPKKKLIIQYHMDVHGLSGWYKILSLPNKLLFRLLFKRADVIISASLDYVKNSAIADIYQKYSKKFREIPFGVDANRFIFREKNSGKFQILFVGGLDQAHYFKGLDVLLEAVAIINREVDDYWELNIVGSGNLKRAYRQKSIALNIDDKVNFLGNIDDEELPAIYGGHSVTVLPSINKAEAFGIVLIESMSTGTPVIASNLAGVRNVFENNKEGLLIRAGNVYDLVDRIKYLMNNPGKLREMGRISRRRVEKQYTLEKVADQLVKII